MAKLFQTGDSTSELTVKITLELANNVWLKRAFLQALILMCNENNWQQDGTATVDFARDKSNEMYVSVEFDVLDDLPAGTVTMWFGANAPSRWLICDGSGWLVSDYPELFDLIGYSYGGSGAFFGLPDMTSRSPMGVGSPHSVGDQFGEATHTLTIPEIPSHTHPPLSPYLGFTGNRSGGVSAGVAGASLNNFGTTGATGGGGSHNNIHPVMSVYFIIYGGKAP